MRNLLLANLFITLMCTNSFAEDKTEVQEIKQAIDAVSTLDEVKAGPNNSINYKCQDCLTDTAIKDAVIITEEEIELKRVMFKEGKDDNRIVIKIDENTPDKFEIKYKERFRGCKKQVAFKNPLTGLIGFHCQKSTTEYKEDSITIDISDRKRTKDGEYVEIELVKLSMRSSGFVNARFREQTGKRISSDRSGKFLFFGTKYNLK